MDLVVVAGMTNRHGSGRSERYGRGNDGLEGFGVGMVYGIVLM